MDINDIIFSLEQKNIICPLPNYWQKIWIIIEKKARKSPKFSLDLPLILDGWHYSNKHQKKERFLDHLFCAERLGILPDVERLIISVPKDGWLYGEGVGIAVTGIKSVPLVDPALEELRLRLLASKPVANQFEDREEFEERLGFWMNRQGRQLSILAATAQPLTTGSSQELPEVSIASEDSGDGGAGGDARASPDGKRLK